jgi:hypothetical protein
MQRFLFSAFCSLLLVAVSLAVAGCDDAGGDASPDAAARNPTAAEAASEEYHDPERIVARRAALRQRVRESFDEPRMFAAAREQFEILDGYQPTAAYDVRSMAHYDQATSRWT